MKSEETNKTNLRRFWLQICDTHYDRTLSFLGVVYIVAILVNVWFVAAVVTVGLSVVLLSHDTIVRHRRWQGGHGDDHEDN